ncbi:hypothetical protein MGN01_20980 [Methylobacterium gnaphalii]|uniref:Uncharacterized protein n=1 Tax=Methylobacterium gnaphalii TaxID=1010610 RepID=A0A512JK02_9HYPH|nr:hypothetical protein MGN01_20980 [Methylobacterium gnaphalii]
MVTKACLCRPPEAIPRAHTCHAYGKHGPRAHAQHHPARREARAASPTRQSPASASGAIMAKVTAGPALR